jgi:hypothetical protein
MYLRTTRRKNRDGSVVEYYQLARNVRHAETGSPVAKIIYNFGRADELDRNDLVRLCRSIAKVCGVEVYEPVGRTYRNNVLSCALCIWILRFDSSLKKLLEKP